MTPTLKSVLSAAALSASLAGAALPVGALAGGKVPCEPLVPKLAAAFKTSGANDADKTKALGLQKTGLAKCKAEKDADAVVDFTAAFKLLGVKP